MPEQIIPNDYPDFQKHGTPPCAESYPDAFFPQEADDFWETDLKSIDSRRNSAQYRYEKEVKAICAACPYKIECAEYAIKNPEILGIWGGTTEKARREIRKARRINGTNQKVISVEIR
jgi:hypothetical protein